MKPVFVVVLALAACSNNRVDPGPVSDGGNDQAAPQDLSQAPAALADLAVGNALRMPHPPAGTTLCKQGSLSAPDIVSACKVPTNFGPAPVQACDGATSNGGRYELWCGGGNFYFWAELDALRPVAASGCPFAAGGFFISTSGNYSVSFGAGPSTVSGPGGAFPIALLPEQSIVVETSLALGSATSFSLTNWIKGADSACPNAANQFQEALIAGVTISYP